MAWFSPCLSLVTLLQPPAAPPPLPPGVHAVRVTTGSGTVTYYTLPPDAPPSVRAALKSVEFAERGVVIAEQLQELKADIVRGERTTEALRTNRAVNGQYPFLLGPGAGNEPGRSAVRLPQGAGGFGFGAGAGYGAGLPFYSPSPFLTDSTLKQALAGVLADEATADAAQKALDRMVAAHDRAKEVLRAYQNAGPAAGRMTSAELRRALQTADDERAARQAELAAMVEKAAARREEQAEKRERDAKAAEAAAEARYRAADPDARDAARRDWVQARDAREKANKEWDAARAVWKAARDQSTAAAAPRTPIRESDLPRPPVVARAAPAARNDWDYAPLPDPAPSYRLFTPTRLPAMGFTVGGRPRSHQ